jgi:hypothetical protein
MKIFKKHPFNYAMYRYLKNNAYGSSNAVSANTLGTLFNLDRRQIRHEISKIRLCPYVNKQVGSNDSGYFIARKGEDGQKRIRSQTYNMIELLILNGSLVEVEGLYKHINDIRKKLDKPSQGQEVLKITGRETYVNYFLEGDELQ